ncbi:hypothetical protein BT69DRAFT_1351765 [Atractiella rhizophila]|nr:hypothetical protein BT69DRAFT_1351765 [Atractiella rhizophila]
MRQKPGTTCQPCKKAKRKCIRADEDLSKACTNCVEKGRECVPQEIKPREVKLGKRQELVRELFGTREASSVKSATPSTPSIPTPTPKLSHDTEMKLTENTLKAHWTAELIDQGFRPSFSVGFIPDFKQRMRDSGTDWKSVSEYAEIVMLMFMIYGARRTSNPFVLGSLRLSNDNGIYADFRPYGRAREGPCRSLLSKLLDECFANEFLSKPSITSVTILLDVFLLVWREFEPAFCSETIRNRRGDKEDVYAGVNEELAWELRRLLEKVKSHIDFHTFVKAEETEWSFKSPVYNCERKFCQEISRFLCCDLANAASLNMAPLMSISDYETYDFPSLTINRRSYYSLSSLINESMEAFVSREEQDEFTWLGMLCLQRQVVLGSCSVKEWIAARRTYDFILNSPVKKEDLLFEDEQKSSIDLERAKAKSPVHLLSSLLTRMDLYSAYRKTTHWVDLPSGQVWGPFGKEDVGITRDNLVQRSTLRFTILALIEEVLDILRSEREMQKSWGLREEEMEAIDEEIRLAEGTWKVAMEKAHEHIDGLLETLCELECHPVDERSIRYFDCLRELILVLQELPGGTSYLARYVSYETKSYLRAEKAGRVQNFLRLNKVVGWFSMSFDRNVQLLENDLAALSLNGPPSPGFMKTEEENDPLVLKIAPVLNWGAKSDTQVKFKPDVAHIPEDTTFRALKIIQEALADIGNNT